MIYLFTWNSQYLVREKTLSWKNAYIEKYGDFNLVHFKDLKQTDNNILNQELLAEWFMWEKKLIIIDDFPLSWSNKDSDLNEKQDFLESILDKIPENNIVIFSSANPDKRSKFYKKIVKIANKVEEFNASLENDIFQIISKKYSNKIDNSAINLLIKYKSWNLEKIISEIEKLFILSYRITENLIKENIFPELEESIFQLIDDILNLDILWIINKINIILEQTNIYLFYNNLIANLRTSVFISNLKSSHNRIEQNRISEILDLKNKAFLVNKNYKINNKQLNNLYIWLIDLDKKMKSWFFIGSEESDFKFEIEKVILETLN